LKVKEKTGPKVADYKKWLVENAAKDSEISSLKNDVISFANKFKLPGVDE
jgi:glycine hydroxymethyltransferase